MGVTLADLDKGQAVILNKLENIVKDVDSKHTQNRSSIHDIREELHKAVDEIWKLKIKIAGYAAIAGVITSVAIHYAEKLIGK